MIHIDSDVPLPSAVDPGIDVLLHRLSIGQSFVDNQKRNPQIWRARAQNLGIKITCHRQTTGFYRIWRVQ